MADQPDGTGAGLRQRAALAPLIALKTPPSETALARGWLRLTVLVYLS